MTGAQQNTFLSAKQLQIGYRHKGRDICIAKMPGLELHPGDFICLLGPNGVGKSTLVRTLAGIQTPLQGTVKLGDQSYDQLSPNERARKISLVLTEMSSLGMFDAYSLVALGRHPYSGRFGMLGSEDRARIDWAFQAIDAKDLKYRQVSKLSDGERQKLLIARALAQETGLMLLDEPTAFLDMPGQIELMVMLKKLAHQEQMGILFSTHNLDLAMRFANHIWLLDKTGIITKGYPEELAVNGAVSRTFSNDAVTWNIAHGDFCIQAGPHLKASVQGKGAYALWTKRALERLGFTLTEDVEGSTLQIKLSVNDQQPEWHINYDGRKISHSSIGALIDWIQGRL